MSASPGQLQLYMSNASTERLVWCCGWRTVEVLLKAVEGGVLKC
ncbi:MAG: hypothetical protein AVDCRST_MAG58-54 [uncultured Rubrobacteraceae bacterium]|uniref:Uncharacterized protein n=1 Tax=uncultured Rubrobacteraceae bacterium TaxID=349277 RepID=A0A6J4QF06_9ACTN|nr:MAG: hypothetical protein AVDCRST_MAG58-54 [uncultured Rubrobacteraceae bacterium]